MTTGFDCMVVQIQRFRYGLDSGYSSIEDTVKCVFLLVQQKKELWRINNI